MVGNAGAKEIEVPLGSSIQETSYLLKKQTLPVRDAAYIKEPMYDAMQAFVKGFNAALSGDDFCSPYEDKCFSVTSCMSGEDVSGMQYRKFWLANKLAMNINIFVGKTIYHVLTRPKIEQSKKSLSG